MKRTHLLFCFVFLIWLTGCTSTPAITHEELLAQIPSLYTDGARQANGTYVGALENSRFLIGVVTQGNLAVAYLCNGETGDWLTGTAANGQVDLSNARGARLTGTLSDGTIHGTATLPEGVPLAFNAAPAREGETGLFRHSTDASGSKIVSGWIVIENGVVGTSTDGGGVSILDRPEGKEEAGGTGSGSNTSDEEKGLSEITVLPDVTPSGEDGQAQTLGDTSPPPCEQTKAGCGNAGGAFCAVLRAQKEIADKNLADLEKDLKGNGVKNLKNNPAFKAAQKPVKNLVAALKENGCDD